MSRIARIVTLIFAGEIIFGLPFHLTRFFRPTFLDAFELSNTDLGIMQAAYGIAAIIAYFPGGALADRFSTRNLLAGSLVVTAAGGLYLATFPDLGGLRYVNFFWGFSTVFLFWAALIRATREWGGQDEQGVAFGVLEAGRGLLAVTVAFITVRIFAGMMPADVMSASNDVRREAFRAVILVYSALPVVAAVLVWRFIPDDKPGSATRHTPWQGMWVVLQRPVVWGQAIVIVCAYATFKGSDNYGLYAKTVLGMNEVDAAKFATWGNLIRPFAAIVAGVVADRFTAARSIGVAFVVLTIAFFGLAQLVPDGPLRTLVFVNIFVSYIAVYSLRAIYFALLEENRTPRYYTGAAVGLVSVVGYAPDYFFGLLTGPILDANPGLVGFQNYFLVLAAFTTLGVIAVLWLLWLHRKGAAALWPGEAAEIKA